MPIYAYRCGACGHACDVLQRMSDPLLTTCTVCGAEALTKQVTAAGFQLKGSGWYATDFKGGGAPRPAAEKAEAGDKAVAEAGKAEPAVAGAPAPAAASTDKSASPAPAAAPAPAPGGA
ncbi:MAG: FmdB family zinc ribbon protein [Aquabacterium sp.]